MVKGHDGDPWELEFKDWKNGSSKSYILKSHEYISERKCPIDGTSLIYGMDGLNSDQNKVMCVNCRTEYYGSNQEEINEYAQKITIPDYQFKIDKLEKERSNLIARIKQAEKTGIIPKE